MIIPILFLSACSADEPAPDNVENLDTGIDYVEEDIALELGFDLPETATVTAVVDNPSVYLVEVRAQQNIEELETFFSAEMESNEYEKDRDWAPLTGQENTSGAVYAKEGKNLSFSVRDRNDYRSISIQKSR